MDQNVALSAQRYSEAYNIQNAIITVLDATSGPNPEGLSANVITEIRNVFQNFGDGTGIEGQMSLQSGSGCMSKTCNS